MAQETAVLETMDTCETMDTVSSEPEPVARPAAGAAPPSKPPRSALRVRDMLVALAVLVPLILVVGGVSRACTFAPGGPTVDPSGLPVVDAPAELRALAPLVPFAVRIPAVPPRWRSNSVDRDLVAGGGRAVRTGYITPEGRFLRLLQTDASEAALVAVESGAEPVVAQGAVEVGGQRWVVYERGGGEPIWIAEVATPGATPVRLLITGSGGQDDFRALAGAAVTGQLLPLGTAPN
ncbi:MAG: DUF4245 domain-containing protein [Pseudonocardia sp.]